MGQRACQLQPMKGRKAVHLTLTLCLLPFFPTSPDSWTQQQPQQSESLPTAWAIPCASGCKRASAPVLQKS